MRYEGTARLDHRTKNLVKYLKPGDIAIIDHADLDRVSAEGLVDARVEMVINASQSISGRYPNLGPLILCSAGVQIIDNVGKDIFHKIKDGDRLSIHNGQVFRQDQLISQGEVLMIEDVEEKLKQAKDTLSAELEKFAINTLDFMKREKDFLFKEIQPPEISTNFQNRHSLVIVRGYDYKADLQTLRSYIREVKPILIGVDGGADALLEEGYQPDIIIGDMDSVTDEALQSGAELIVHAYPGGRAPGLERLRSLYLNPVVFEAPGTSEDIAMILAYEKGAELIVAVGTHYNLIEFLDKGRQGMASTFLARLRVGDKLVDAKGVSKLYRSTIRISYLAIMLLAALSTIVIIILVSSSIKHLINLAILNLRLWLGL